MTAIITIHDYYRNFQRVKLKKSCMIKITALWDGSHSLLKNRTVACVKKMKRILVPCDFSEPAQEAFKFALTIAQQSKGEVHVLYILDMTFLRGNPSLSHNYAFNVNFLKEMEEEANSNFQKMWQKFSPRTLAVKFHQRIGSLVMDIESYIQANGIDLVIMGTHGAGGSKWGSNTEKIVRNAPVPVIAIRKNPDGEIKKIVVPIVPEHRDREFAERLKEIQRFFKSKLHLLWVNTPGNFKSDPQSQVELSRYAQTYNLTNVSLSIRADHTVEEGVLRFARETRTDMIAIGTHGRKGLDHWFTGSIAEDIVNEANYPIWTFTLR